MDRGLGLAWLGSDSRAVTSCPARAESVMNDIGTSVVDGSGAPLYAFLRMQDIDKQAVRLAGGQLTAKPCVFMAGRGRRGHHPFAGWQ